MIESENDVTLTTEDLAALAEQTEQVIRRLEAGEAIGGNGLSSLDNSLCLDPINQLLPTLKTMVSLGEQLAREEGSRTRMQKSEKRKLP